MDGDIAPLDKLYEVCEKYGVITMVDDAHGEGVVGRGGRGIVDHFGLHGKFDVEIGTLSNARGFWISGDPFRRIKYDDPKIEKLRNWFCYKAYSGDFIVEQDCHNFDVLHWFLGGLPIRAVGYGGTKVRTTMEIMDHLTLSFEWPNGIHVNFEANQLTPPGFNRVGEEFTGTKGSIETSRARMIHHKGLKDHQTIESKRDITYEGIEQFLERVVTNNPENVAERSAQSTMIALLGRTAIYTGKEQTWKGLFGA